MQIRMKSPRGKMNVWTSGGFFLAMLGTLHFPSLVIPATSHTISAGATATIDEHGVCREVKNNHSGGSGYCGGAGVSHCFTLNAMGAHGGGDLTTGDVSHLSGDGMVMITAFP